MRVIDSSVLIKYFSREEEGWVIARRYIVDGGITLDLALKELGNALWKKMVKKEINPETATQILSDIIVEKPIIIEDEVKYLVEALKYSIKNKITIYDSLFIIMAKNKKLELVTADKKQADVARKTGVKTILI